MADRHTDELLDSHGRDGPVSAVWLLCRGAAQRVDLAGVYRTASGRKRHLAGQKQYPSFCGTAGSFTPDAAEQTRNSTAEGKKHLNRTNTIAYYVCSMNTDEPIEARIEALKKARNAVVLVHNYQLPEVQDIADFTGDSLQLSQQAAKTDADVIVFCGVRFMAETAAMLSPDKTVLMPDEHAGCPMADMISAEQLRQFKQAHTGAVVVCYVNSSAEVKAESDYCCTSSNATAVVNSLKDAEEIIFVPDKYLGQYASLQTRREMILWNGYCHVHVRIGESDIVRARAEHPDALVMVHPECTEPVRELADAVLSTGGMCDYAKQSDADEFIVGTEIGILHRLRKENPGKRFYPASEAAVCPNMKLTTVEKILWSLESMQYQIKVPDEIRLRAIRAIENMINTTA